MHFEMLTLFPRMFDGYAGESVLGKARAKGVVTLGVTDIRDFAFDKHHVTDDTPYGGGAGMVMKVEPLALAIESARAKGPGAKVLLTSPRGSPFDAKKARAWSQCSGLVIVCGRYEGVDERVVPLVDELVSLGDFVLTGGELVALSIFDAVARFVPGVLGNEASSALESFESGLLEFPQYTRPLEFRGQRVPDVLMSGDHQKIERFRRLEALRLTQLNRPDLFQKLTLSPSEQKSIAQFDLSPLPTT